MGSRYAIRIVSPLISRAAPVTNRVTSAVTNVGTKFANVPIRPRVIFTVATGLGFFSGFQAYYFVNTFTQRPASFPLLLALNLSYWYSWAILTPGIIWLARKFPFERRAWKLSALVHLAGVFSATLLHVGLTVASRLAIFSLINEPSSPWWIEAQRMFFLNFDWEMMTYWAIIGLSYTLWYQREAQDRTLRASQLETHLVAARLQALQRQLQPHFLFNTLNTISALMHRDVDAADNMIARLSDLLRLSLQTVGVQETTLKSELDFVSKYLEIEQTRFRDRLTVVFHVQPDTLDALVPNLILQPLVENSIKHGIAAKPSHGQIEIIARRSGTTDGGISQLPPRARREGSRDAKADTAAGGILELEVHDNGVGLSDARLSDFNRGVGLTNTRSRLQHLYGAAHRFEFRPREGGGLAVLIAIPFTESAEASAGRRHPEFAGAGVPTTEGVA